MGTGSVLPLFYGGLFLRVEGFAGDCGAVSSHYATNGCCMDLVCQLGSGGCGACICPAAFFAGLPETISVTQCAGGFLVGSCLCCISGEEGIKRAHGGTILYVYCYYVDFSQIMCYNNHTFFIGKARRGATL